MSFDMGVVFIILLVFYIGLGFCTVSLSKCDYDEKKSFSILLFWPLYLVKNLIIFILKSVIFLCESLLEVF